MPGFFVNTMIVLFTDFGIEGPYIGQVKASLNNSLPQCTIIDLFSDLPPFNPQAAAVLLAAYSDGFPAGTVFLCVVDPGVGMAARRPVVLKSKECWFVGPDNGLFDLLLKYDGESKWWTIDWRPEQLSNTFHGRDLFAPIAAEIESGMVPLDKLSSLELPDLEMLGSDYPYIAYIDHYGNVITGLRSGFLAEDVILKINGHEITYARTFGEVGEQSLFWYKNSNGLLEVAANCGSAAKMLNAAVGDAIGY